jgi:DivIVA domain-containing protein
MSQDAFTLTPHDVRAQEFTRALRGYERAEVDAFKERMAEELDRVLRERAQLDERIRNLTEQLRAFRDRERAMNEALLAAQQLRHDSQVAAEREAELVLREARAEGERIVERSRSDERLVRERAESAARQFAAYVAAFRALLERQLAELDVLESHTRTIVQVQGEALGAAAAPRQIGAA